MRRRPEAGDLDRAHQLLERARREAPTQFAADAEAGGWKALQELGTIALERGRTDGALARWREAHAEAFDLFGPNWVLGQALLSASRAAEALPFVRRAAEIDQTHASAHLALARALVADE